MRLRILTAVTVDVDFLQGSKHPEQVKAVLEEIIARSQRK